MPTTNPTRCAMHAAAPAMRGPWPDVARDTGGDVDSAASFNGR